jgi:hypothetical protein
MDSLTTAYIACIFIGSLGAIAAAVAGSKMAPIESSVNVVADATPPKVEPAPEKNEKDDIHEVQNIAGGKSNVYTPASDVHDKIVYTESIPTEFFDDQMQFFNTLTSEEKTILSVYTTDGDKIINSVLRGQENIILNDLINQLKKDYGNSIIPLLFDVNEITEENKINAFNAYVAKIQQIFEKTPAVRTQFKVFRGTQTPTPEFKGITSTTYDPMNNSLTTAFSGPDCCIYELTVMPGAKAIWLDPISNFSNEREIILSDKNTINITKQTKKEVWSYLTKLRPLNKSTKTVYEGTVAAI